MANINPFNYNDSDKINDVILKEFRIYSNIFFESMPKVNSVEILTLNCLGNPNIKYTRENKRTKYLVDAINKSNFDIIFLQEVGVRMLKKFKNKIIGYNFSEVDPSIHSNDFISTIILSKFSIIKTFYGVITGDHSYSFVMCLTEQFCLVNLYLHAGSSLSPGLINTSKYHLYRQLQMEIIYDQLQKFNSEEKKVLIGGDFNFCLDDVNKIFIEHKCLSMFKKINLTDLWLRFDKHSQGLTESTDNDMRWNFKQTIKNVRCDGFLGPSEWIVSDAKLFGTECIFTVDYDEQMSDKDYSEHFIKANLDQNKLKVVDGLFRWYLSDHYGVQFKLILKD